jgi:hypothetical protein
VGLLGSYRQFWLKRRSPQAVSMRYMQRQFEHMQDDWYEMPKFSMCLCKLGSEGADDAV